MLPQFHINFSRFHFDNNGSWDWLICTQRWHSLPVLYAPPLWDHAWQVYAYAIPVNMPDPIQKRFGYSQRVARIRLDCICQIQPLASFSVPFLQRRHGPYCAKLTWIWSGCPGQALVKLIWSEASWFAEIIEPSSRQDTTYLLPVSHFRLGCILPQMSRIIAYKTSPDPVSLWLIVPGFGQMDPVQKKANMQESSSSLLANAFQPIRPGWE